MKVNLSELVSFKEAAAIRNVSVQAIHGLVNRKRLTVVIVSDRKFLLRKEVEEFQPDPGGRPRKKADKKRPKTKSRNP